MATLRTSENNPNRHCANVCDLCWTAFPTADELARHVDEEEWTLYPVAVN